MSRTLRIHLVIFSSEEYHSREKFLHGHQVWCDWKQLYRFFPTMLLTHIIFLYTEFNDRRLSFMKIGTARNSFFFLSPLLNDVVNDLAFLVHCVTAEACPRTDTCGAMPLACRNVQKSIPSLLHHSGLG